MSHSLKASRHELAQLPFGTKVVVGAFAISGVTHLVKPEVFYPLIPSALAESRTRKRTLVWVSGVAELVATSGLATRQPWAPAATSATLAAVWVGNWEMARRWQHSEKTSPAMKVAGWARLPLQLPLIYWAWTSPVGVQR